MPGLNRNKNITCCNCGTPTTKRIIVRHKTRCSAGTLFCSQCSNFSTKSQSDLIYHIAKKHSASKPSITYKCKLCHAEFPGFHALRQHKNTQQGPQIGFGANSFDVEDIVGDVDDQSSREELEPCKHFLTDTGMEIGRHRDVSLLNDELNYVFNEMKCAAKVNIPFGFVLKKIEDGVSRYFYAHENIIIIERSKLVCTQAGKTNVKDRMQKKKSCWYLYLRKNQYKVENLQTYKFNKFRFVTQRCTNGLSYLNHFWETVMWIVLLLREIQDNPTTKISVCLEH